MVKKARFEAYVEERVAEIASAKRAKLKAAYDAEVAKAESRGDRYVKMARDGVEALVRKIVAQAKRDGCVVRDDGGRAAEGLSDYAKGRVLSLTGLHVEYDCDSGRSLWPKGTPAREAQDALTAFDGLCAREAGRILVYKMDLGMKPEAFERMLAETAERINRG